MQQLLGTGRDSERNVATLLDRKDSERKKAIIRDSETHTETP